MRRMWIKRMIGLLAAVLLCGVLGAAAQTETADGSFWLWASSKNRPLIEPVAVPYSEGQTLLEAVTAAGYRLTGSGGFVESIEGETGNYQFCCGENGEYDLNAPASGVKVLCAAEYDMTAQARSLLALVTRMGEYRTVDDHVQNYAPAAQAYMDALLALRTSAAEAESLLAALDDAVAQYHALMNGEKYTVCFSVSQGGKEPETVAVSMTDAYGNVTTANGASVDVIAGNYRFCVSNGAQDRVEGMVTVAGACTVTCALPEGDWFGAVKLLGGKNGLNGERRVYESEAAGDGRAVYYVADAAGAADMYLFAEMGADVPDETKTRLRAIYTDTAGIDRSTTARSWESTECALRALVAPGCEERIFTIEAQYETADGCTQIQSYTMQIVRVPTLSSLTVTADGTRLPLNFTPEGLEYSLQTVSEAVTVEAQPFGADYRVEGTGNVSVSANGSQHSITVSAPNGQSRSYRLNIEKCDAVLVSVTGVAGAQTHVYNAAGADIAPDAQGKYALIAGQEYICAAVRGNSRAERRFTAADGLTVAAAEPVTESALVALALYDKSSASTRRIYERDDAGAYIVSDANSQVYAQLTAAEGWSAVAMYARQTRVESTDGLASSISLNNAPVAADGRVAVLSYCVIAGGRGQTVTLRLSKSEGDVTWYQDHTVTLRRQLHLRSLSLAGDGDELLMMNAEGTVVSFDRDTTAYYVTVDRRLEALTLVGSFMNEAGETASCGGYWAEIDGERFDSIASVRAALSGDGDEDIAVEIGHADESSIHACYTIHVAKTEPVMVSFITNPSDACLVVNDETTGRRVWPEADGRYALSPGGSYGYTVTKNGYIGREISGYAARADETEITVTLEKAPASALTQYAAEWPSLRADANNNAVISAKTPTDPDDTVLYWATRVGEGWDAEACGSPILVGGSLYTYAGSWIYKLDAATGEVLLKKPMDHASSFAITPPTYAEGMIFVGLADGTIQAFNAQTLESLWLYRDPLKGQPNCPIAYHDGYIYTGFWLGEESNANFVCLSITDEDPTQSKEEKLASWTYTSAGGFYWAGAYVCDDYLLVGTDDGCAGYTSGHARFLSLDPKNGAQIDSITLPHTGDARSGVTMHGATAYFTTKGGVFYGVPVSADGHLGALRYILLSNYASDPANPAMSTSTPTIYNGRAYVGVSGTAQFSPYSGHNITVIDLDRWTIAYSVRTMGYPQTSALLTTAYDSVYAYFLDNYTPGMLRVLKDGAGVTSAVETDVESYTSGGKTTDYTVAKRLFTPSGAQAQYAIGSPIADSFGTLYFKNDSGYIMAVGSRVERLELTSAPTRTQYAVGECFDPTGMVVTAYYTNGQTRDVTECVTWYDGALRVSDSELVVEYPYALYHDENGEGGVACEKPMVVVSLTIRGDVNADGELTVLDANMAYAIANGKLEPTEGQRYAADMDGSGTVDVRDAEWIYALANGQTPEE